MSDDPKERRRLRALLLGDDYADAAEALLEHDPPRAYLKICPHPAPTNLCRACEVKRRAERMRAQGIEVRDA